MSAEVVALESGAAFFDDAAQLRACLGEPVPRIPPWFGYDARGSALFEAITELPTYYLTRAEWGLLRRHGDDIAARLGCGRVAELGSGSAKKTRLLLEACARLRPTTYLPVDVSAEMLRHSAAELTAEVPELTVTGLWGRYEAGLDHLHAHPLPDDPVSDSPISDNPVPGDAAPPLAVLFLGANLGNTTPAERDSLLARIAATLRPGDAFLVSADLVKPGAVFETCYNDPPGHSAFAEFRLNHLGHLDRRFGPTAQGAEPVDLSGFRPEARYDAAAEVVEGRLWPRRDRRLPLPGLGLELEVRRDTGINVGFSAKFDRDRFRHEVGSYGLRAEAEWVDPDLGYGIFLFRRRAGGAVAT